MSWRNVPNKTRIKMYRCKDNRKQISTDRCKPLAQKPAPCRVLELYTGLAFVQVVCIDLYSMNNPSNSVQRPSGIIRMINWSRSASVAVTEKYQRLHDDGCKFPASCTWHHVTSSKLYDTILDINSHLLLHLNLIHLYYFLHSLQGLWKLHKHKRDFN